ncbi:MULTISPECIES: hypothetical protein [unclassified Leptolyngbya]|uniref:hypothetical protein n=1 Tax=unclassified Leptolyngbya TaxID=2650499 RepID=UPI0016880069|nr:MULTISPECIES: hypothetical protein [unclassified Leptolyngbya]MBD1910432.1 hypothetical protein [Leptolyngbya sp. FACHB-8]MBD2154201.1 hypothetical protein [Leptolyngbya sp. FACHB-16]
MEDPHTAGGHLGAKVEEMDDQEHSIEQVIANLVAYGMMSWAHVCEFRNRQKALCIVQAPDRASRGDADNGLLSSRSNTSRAIAFTASLKLWMNWLELQLLRNCQFTSGPTMLSDRVR